MSFSSLSDEYLNANIRQNNFSEKNDNFDWDKINCNLQINGFPEVPLKFNDDDDLYFDKDGTIALRYLIADLLKKNVKSQEIVRDSLNECEKLKAQLKDNRFVIKRYEETIKHLNDSLLETKQRIKEVSNSQRSSIYGLPDNTVEMKVVHSNQLTEQSRQIVITRYHNLQQICDEQRQEINMLQIKLNKLTSLEESRRHRQIEIFHQLKHKAPNSYNAIDKRLLDIIDSYECKVLQLESHMTFFSNLGFSLPDDDMDNGHTQVNNNASTQRIDVSDEFKQVLAKMQEEIQNIRREKETVEEKCELLKLESNCKPSLQELKDVINKLKEYKQLLNFHNIRPEKERILRSSHRRLDGQSLEYPNMVEDIEFLPLKTCQRYLVDLCAQLNANSVTDAFKYISDFLEMNTVFPFYFSLFTRITQLVHTPGLSQFGKSTMRDLSETQPVEIIYNEMVNILESWVHQLCSISQLFNLVKQLRSTLFPWNKPVQTLIRPGIHGVIDTLNDILDQCEVKEDLCQSISATAGQYKGLVEHFQNIFNCPNIIGAYAKMNIVYTKYTEMQNILDTLKKIMHIEDMRGLACIVAEVDGLVEINQNTYNNVLDNLGMTKDIETLVTKLEKYEDFVPAFEDLVSEVTDLLGIDSIDEIVPRVRSLQESAQVIRQ